MTTLAIASALPALLAAATLSLTKPGDYYYVNITATNSLEGVGMGATAPSEDKDAPLRYEDIAFLAEAYAERVGIFDKASLGTSATAGTVTTNIWANPNSIVTNYAKCFRYGGMSPTGTYDTALSSWDFGFYAPLFLDPSLTPISEATVASRVNGYYGNSNIVSIRPGIAWCDVFNTSTPFISAAGIDASAFEKDTPLDPAPISVLYADLTKLTCPAAYAYGFKDAPLDGAYIGLSNHYTNKKYDSTSSSPTTTEDVTYDSTSIHLPIVNLYLYAAKHKKRSFTIINNDYDNAQPGEVTSSENFTERWNTCFINANDGSFYINLYPAFSPLAVDSSTFRRATAVKAFALGRAEYYARQTPMTTTYSTYRRYFVMPLSVSFVGGIEMPFLLSCNVGGEGFAKGLLDTARSLFSDVPKAGSGEAFLGSIAEPSDPSASAPYDDLRTKGYRSTVNEKEAHVSVGIQSILVYFDMKFHSIATEPTE